MALMEDQYLKRKYYKYKVYVKLWESEFIEKYGRKPNKSDIKAADNKIRNAYKIYWDLKSKFLDETLSEVPFCNKHEENCSSGTNEVRRTLYSSNSEILENAYFVDNTSTIEGISALSNNKISINKSWGHHLDKEKDNCKQNETNSQNSLVFQLSQEMFSANHFCKRNPRKLDAFSKSQNNFHNRNKLNDCLLGNKDDNINHPDSNECTKLLEYTNKSLNVISCGNQVSCKPCNTIEKLIQGSPKKNNVPLNDDWLNSCIDNDVFKNDIKIVKSIQASDSIVHPNEYSEDEDYICSSDSKLDHPNKRVLNSNKITSNTDIVRMKKKCRSSICNVLGDIKDVKIYTDRFLSNQNKMALNFSDMTLCNLNPNEILTKQNDQMGIKNIRKINRINRYINLDTCNNALKKDENYTYKSQIDKKDKNENNDKTNLFNSSSNDYLNEHSQISLNVSTSTNYNNFLEEVKPSNFLSDTTLLSQKKLEEKSKNKTVKKLNENFVRVNLKKKVFVRGKKCFNFSKYKKNQWKKKKNIESFENKLNLLDSIDKYNKVSCFKCGDISHIARQCKYSKCDKLLSIDSDVLNDVDDLTKLTSFKDNLLMNSQQNKEVSSNTNQLRKIKLNNFSDVINDDGKQSVDNKVSSDFILLEQPIENHLSIKLQKLSPLYGLKPDGSVKDTPVEVFEALSKFGHKHFRNGQEYAIMRTLSGLSTLVTIATGSGKSLCYQLPAYMYAQKSKCITLVISPLVSLMDDQVSESPDFLPAACLHTNQSSKLQTRVINDLKAGKIMVLLVSPEAIVTNETTRDYGNILWELPPIAFACIDEAHCISQWSHNFRPSYLKVCQVLREKLGVKNILALTATATNYVTFNIIKSIKIKDGILGVIKEKPLPSNLNLSVSRDQQREEALLNLLYSDKFCRCNSIIIYCTRREECSRIAGVLRISLQKYEVKTNNLQKNNGQKSSIAEAYHAGLNAHRRKLVYRAFMKSETRIIVATVAFGMGINKPNIGSVIHYNMPSNLESYVQEIGRAGRDSLPAYCHLFLNSKENSDECELRRHINADGIDRHTIKRLLKKIFLPCKCMNLNISKSKIRCQGHEIGFSVEETVRDLDINEETITTLLCYLEMHSRCFIKLLPSANLNAKIWSHNGPKDIILSAQSSPAMAMALNVLKENNRYQEDDSSIEFSVINLASILGVNSNVVKNQLKKLEWKIVNGEWKRSALTVKFNTLGFRVQAPGDLTSDELDEALESLFNQSQAKIFYRLEQLNNISSILRKYSFPSVREFLVSTNESNFKSEELKHTIRSYFESDEYNPTNNLNELPTNKLSNEEQIISNIRSLISSYKDTNFTGRSIARIFHGIQSPNYPALVWSHSRFWRIHLTDDFNEISRLAAKEIINLK